MQTSSNVTGKFARLPRLRVIGWLFIIGGLALLGLSITADLLGLGDQAGFGETQAMAAAVGLVIAGSGLAVRLGTIERVLARPRLLTVIVCLGVPVLLYLTGIAWVFPFEVDDSYISMRYASNLASGYGLVFNPGGARIEGYTNLLLVLIESVLIRAGVQTLWLVKLLLTGFGLAVLATITWYGWQRLGGDADEKTFRWLPAIATLLTATSSPFILWTVGGLETILFVLFVCIGAVGYLLFLGGRLRGSKVLLVDLAFVVATLTRPEGLLFWVATLGHTLGIGLIRRGKSLTRVRVAGILSGLTLLASYGLWKLNYFGQLLPATYLAKQPQLRFGTFVLGGKRLLGFLAINGNFFLCLLIVVGLMFAVRRRIAIEAPLWYLVALGGVYLAYVLSLGFQIAMDDAYRFYVPLIPVMSLLLFELTLAFRTDIKRNQSAWMAGCLVAIVLLIPLRFDDLWSAWQFDLNWGVFRYQVAARDIASGLHQGHIALGRWLREHASSDATIVLSDAGAIPYFSGLRTIDTWSLTDPHLLALNRALISAGSDVEREHIRGNMRSYVLSQDPEYIIDDNLSLLDDPVVQARYRPSGKTFVYLNWYMCGRQRSCRYILEPWQRHDVR